MAQTQVTTDVIADDAITAAKIDNNAVGAAAMADDAIGIAELSATGTASGTTFLCGNNTWTAVGGAYSDWLVKTANFTCASGDQLVCNHASTAFTITLPAGSAGNTVVIANAGAALVTIEANGSEKINSSTDDGTLPQGNSAQLVYVDGTIGWFEV